MSKKIISFRLSQDSIDKLKSLAEKNKRSQANMLDFILSNLKVD